MAQSTIHSQQDEQLQKGKALLPTPSLQGPEEGGIVCFKGSKDVLSNFYLDKFRHHGVLVNCVEQAYQYEKARMYGCDAIAEEIMKLRSGYCIWVLAKKIQVDDRWEQSRVRIMRGILQSRLQQSVIYQQKLNSIRGIIVEAVPGDKFWSAGLNADQVLKTAQADWPGQNVMGRLHMEMRQQQPQHPQPVPPQPKKRACEEDECPTDAKQLKKDDLFGKCNWCGQTKELLPGKKFCQRCSTKGKECAHCHRPMADKFYTLSTRLCNRCHNKYFKQLEKRRQEKLNKILSDNKVSLLL